MKIISKVLVSEKIKHSSECLIWKFELINFNKFIVIPL